MGDDQVAIDPPGPYAFPFFGAGEATYFEWAEVHVCFATRPPKQVRAAIANRVPQPLSDVTWRGANLMVSSDQMVNVWIAEAYGDVDLGQAMAGLSDPRELDPGDAVDRFNADIEQWLAFTHQQWPIVAAYRMEDYEAGGTRLSDWHRWSLTQLPEVAAALAPALRDPSVPGLSYPLKGIIDMAEQAHVDLPEKLRDWRYPAAGAVAALRRGDRTSFATQIGAHTSRPVLKDLRRFIEERNEQGWPPDELAMVLDRARECLAMPNPPARFVAAVASAAAKAGAVSGSDATVASTAADVLAAAGAQARTRPVVADRLGWAAYELVTRGDFKAALSIFDIAVDGAARDLSLYNNALYAVQADNNFLPVSPERARHYLDAGLRHGPRNPAIFYNAACVWFELADIDETLSCLRAAIEHGYDDPDRMRQERLFAPIAEDERFMAVFAGRAS